MALLAVQLGDSEAFWTDDPDGMEFRLSIGNGMRTMPLTREDFETLLVSMNRLLDMDLTRNMKFRSV